MTTPLAPLEIPLWPGKELPRIPEQESYFARSDDLEKPNGAVQFVSRPALRVYLPPGVRKSTPAVIICPGGAYQRIAIDKEGVETARWLNRLGIAALLLKYRMPRPEISGPAALPWPLEDGFQALRVAQENATNWNIDPSRIGLMGFSAGGHLTSFISTRPALDWVKPKFLILIYPVTSLADVAGTRTALLGEDPAPEVVSKYSTTTQPGGDTPATFIIHARDDSSVPYQDTLAFQAALRSVGVSCEVHLFERGGHAFGLEGEGEVSTWPDLCETWLRSTIDL